MAAVVGPGVYGRPVLTTDWRSDFRRLWLAYALGQIGSGVATGGLALVAVLTLAVADWQVSVLGAVSAITTALVALPLGSRIEFRRKRPVMIAADLLAAAALLSVPVAWWLGRLTFAQLCVVGALQVLATVSFAAAAGAHLKGLVAPDARVWAQSRLDSTMWGGFTLGPPAGGALASAFGPVLVLAVDAVSYLGSALGIRRLRSPEPDPPARQADQHWRAEMAAGWRFVLGHPGLRALFCNALLFGGGIMLISPLLAVLVLRDLGLAPWQYGLLLGVSGLGGLVGATLAPRAVRWWGERAVLLGAGTLRAVWMPLLVVAPPGTAGFVLVTAAETLLLFFAGLFNPTFASYRMTVTPDELMSRVGMSWSVATRTVQPLFIALGGLVTALAGLRAGIAVGAGVLLVTGALLPWRATADGARR